jgi:hypothetical protein
VCDTERFPRQQRFEHVPAFDLFARDDWLHRRVLQPGDGSRINDLGARFRVSRIDARTDPQLHRIGRSHPRRHEQLEAIALIQQFGIILLAGKRIVNARQYEQASRIPAQAKLRVKLHWITTRTVQARQ